ncbi:hypothetical protein [Nocardioides humi]|uniref:TRAP-type C4-dicarboxylate transport system, substrate-binding protein n=1 Tax=Nocardioides humi TaxID=449461 RepID=A0ABN2BHM7_9ACTN|nr:hypothetical protein [Nocardioides humi]
MLVAIMAALVLSGCAEQEGEQKGGGVGLAIGATKEDFVAALADMSPVTLRLQSTAPQGAATGRRFEDYAKAVEDWSGGKITFDIAYANAVVPPAEVADAINDGRLDMGSVVTTLVPTDFPVNGALWDLSFLGRQSPVGGLLQSEAMLLDASVSTPEIYDEFADLGLFPVVPAFTAGSVGLACSSERNGLDTLGGNIVASQSRTTEAQARALGMTHVSANYTEMFESLERGVVDCTLTSLTVAALSGFIPAAPHFVIDQETGFGNSGGSFVVNADKWDSLPLAARQLLFDRADVFLTANFEGAWDNIKDAVGQFDEADGEVSPMEPDTKAELEAFNKSLIDAARSNAAIADAEGFVDTIEESLQTWSDLEGDAPTDYAEFADWYESGSVDLTSYLERLWTTTMDKKRPR